eukprot:3762292-Prymnesium_polylepis.1
MGVPRGPKQQNKNPAVPRPWARAPPDQGETCSPPAARPMARPPAQATPGGYPAKLLAAPWADGGRDAARRRRRVKSERIPRARRQAIPVLSTSSRAHGGGKRTGQ